MARDQGVVEGRWRIIKTEVWGRDALDLIVPAHITLSRNGLVEMQLIAIGASIDYRVEKRSARPVVEFSWSGFDDGDPTSGRAWARVEGDTMRGKLFIHQRETSQPSSRSASVGSGGGRGLTSRCHRRPRHRPGVFLHGGAYAAAAAERQGVRKQW